LVIAFANSSFCSFVLTGYIETEIRGIYREFFLSEN
jgi:hypothetical protein